MFDVSNISGLVQIYRDAGTTLGDIVLIAYPTSDLNYFTFNADYFEISISNTVYRCLFSELTINMYEPYDYFEAVESLGIVFNTTYTPEIS